MKTNSFKFHRAKASTNFANFREFASTRAIRGTLVTRHLPLTLITLLFWCAAIAFAPPARAQQLKPGEKLDPLSMQWPRFFATNGYEFAVYQPQIAKWPSNHIEG